TNADRGVSAPSNCVMQLDKEKGLVTLDWTPPLTFVGHICYELVYTYPHKGTSNLSFGVVRQRPIVLSAWDLHCFSKEFQCSIVATSNRNNNVQGFRLRSVVNDTISSQVSEYTIVQIDSGSVSTLECFGNAMFDDSDNDSAINDNNSDKNDNNNDEDDNDSANGKEEEPSKHVHIVSRMMSKHFKNNVENCVSKKLNDPGLVYVWLVTNGNWNAALKGLTIEPGLYKKIEDEKEKWGGGSYLES
ncbi:hypothetical protein RFI_14053, partial [Reticulomyxa filosa]